MPIILHQAQIPQNTGNVIRLCAVIGQSLILVRPLGFRMTDRYLKRAGLDYWKDVGIELIDDLEAFLSKTTQPFYFFSSHATQCYTEIPYTTDDLLIFGSETTGLPKELLTRYPERCFTIPMLPDQRCLNLSNSVAIVAYESWRQRGWNGSKTTAKLS